MTYAIPPNAANGLEGALPPHSIEAEQCYLASLCLSDPTESVQVLAEVSADRFFSADNQIIYTAVKHIFDRGQRPDAVVLLAELKQRQVLEEIGGLAALVKLFGMVPSPAHWKAYADVINDRALRRDIIRAAHEAIRAANGPSADFAAEDLLSDGMARLAAVQARTAKATPQTIGDVAMIFLDGMEKQESPLIHTGLPSLDDAIGGIAPGETWLIAGRPSMGKSTAARQIACGIACSVPVAYFSLEESAMKVARNIVSMYGSVENGYLRKGINPKDTATWAIVTSAVGKIQNIPIYIVDRSGGFNGAFNSIRSTASMLVHRYGCRAMVLDYLSLVQGFRGSPYERVTEISMALTGLAKELQVPLILLAQLNRANTAREDKRPGMSDLRDSGQIEQDADGIIFIHREDYYHLDNRARTPTNVAEFIIAKCRDGARGGVVKMRSELKYQRFVSYGPGEIIPGEGEYQP